MVHGIISNTSDSIQHEVLCYNTDLAGKENNLPADDTFNGIRIHRVKYRKYGWFHFGSYPVSLLKKADIIHVHNTELLLDHVILLKFIFRLRAKIIVSTHGMIFHHQKMMFLKNLYMILGFSIKQRFIDKILATGMSDYIYFKNYLDIKDISLVENQVSNFPDISQDKNNKKGLISINRVQNSKNVAKLIDVCDLLRQSGYNEPIAFILSGNYNEFSLIENQILSRSLNIKLYYECSDEEKWRLLGESKCFISLSEYEGFGIAILEALLMNCHVFIHQTVAVNFDHHHFENLHPFENEISVSKISDLLLKKSESVPVPVKSELLQLFNWTDKSKEIAAVYRNLSGL